MPRIKLAYKATRQVRKNANWVTTKKQSKKAQKSKPPSC